MKKDIHHILNTTQPALSPKERGELWERIHESLSKNSIRSPFQAWFLLQTPLARIAVVIALIVGGGVTTVGAHESGPGDFLFPLDRALERIELKLTRSSEKRSEVAIAHAEERLSELKVLIATSDTDDSNSNTATTSSYVHIDTAVNALMDVLETSNMSDTARERIYENFFDEIDPLSVDMKIDSKQNRDSERERVQIERDERGETKIEIREENKRTRIEKKDGHVRIEYDEEITTHDRSEIRIDDDKKRSRDRSDE
jgi:hypothetical protein